MSEYKNLPAMPFVHQMVKLVAAKRRLSIIDFVEMVLLQWFDKNEKELLDSIARKDGA